VASPGDALVVEPEATRADRRRFLEFPYRLNAGHPAWVPPLRMAETKLMHRGKNPFFEHGEAQHFLARRGDRIVGRIAAIENRLYNEYQADRTGFFGFFDCEPDPEVARALVDAARVWTGRRGLHPMVGPVCYSTNDQMGVLVEGFQHPPAVLMPWNRPDYDALLLGAGLEPAKDLLGYEITHRTPAPERFVRVVRARLERTGVRLRPVDVRRLDEEVTGFLEVYNRSWERNWGFVPMTEAEFRLAARDMKSILHRAMSSVAVKDGRTVGFCLAIKDLNQVIGDLGGRLFPFGIFRLLWRLPRIRRVRMIALGLLPEYRGKGIYEAFFLHAHEQGMATGVEVAECSWILEDNLRARAPVETAGGVLTKRYRLYRTSEADRRTGPRSASPP
jgi:GNAT superfamily N-acetyltransferase